MQAFHNDPAIKEMYLERVQAHQFADEIIQGHYWENGKGCAVGCTIHGDEHSRYETELGIPRQIAYLQDRIFEGLANEEAKEFPLAFLQAVPVGADLSLVVSHFLLWLLVDSQDGVIRFASERGKKAIEQVASLYRRKIAGESISEQDWRLAAAYADAYAAADAAADAAAAAYAAAYAADADAYAAAYAAADADAYAAADAAAYAAADAAAAYRTAKQQHFQKMRDKLLALLAEAPVVEQAAK